VGELVGKLAHVAQKLKEVTLECREGRKVLMESSEGRQINYKNICRKTVPQLRLQSGQESLVQTTGSYQTYQRLCEQFSTLDLNPLCKAKFPSTTSDLAEQYGRGKLSYRRKEKPRHFGFREKKRAVSIEKYATQKKDSRTTTEKDYEREPSNSFLGGAKSEDP